MPLIFSENEATESGIVYQDRTGISYQFPSMYRQIVLRGERFIYYKGRKKKGGGRGLQVYFGSGIVGNIEVDWTRPGCFVCEILDYQAFPASVPFKNSKGRYLELGGHRPGYFQRGVRKISEGEFESILRMANALVPQRRAVQRIARLCWNTKGWRYPSGPAGKSSGKNLYENERGFGHEEWLFDISRLVNGVHYGFLQGLHRNRAKLSGDLITLHLYTINSEEKSRYWIGKISEAEVVLEQESRTIWSFYKQRGWLEDMALQLRAVGLRSDPLKKMRPEHFFNLKFRVENISLLEEPVVFDKSDPAVLATYYTTLPRFSGLPSAITQSFEFEFVPGHTHRVGRTKRSTRKTSIETDLAHNRMQSAIYAQLCQEYGEKCVGTENMAGLGSKIDVVLKTDTGHVFFVFLMQNSLKGCIREAIGQLLEYGYWSGQEPAKKLIVISPNRVNDEALRYLNLLRAKFAIPIYYRRFAVESQRLEPEEF